MVQGVISTAVAADMQLSNYFASASEVSKQTTHCDQQSPVKLDRQCASGNCSECQCMSISTIHLPVLTVVPTAIPTNLSLIFTLPIPPAAPLTYILRPPIFG